MSKLKSKLRLFVFLAASAVALVGSSVRAHSEPPAQTQLAQEETHNYGNAGVVESDQEYNKKIAQFRDDVIHGRKAAVAASMHYPLKWNTSKRGKIRNAAALMRQYDKVFSPRMIAAIRDASTHDLFSRYDGVMISNGLIWFDAQGHVYAINGF